MQREVSARPGRGNRSRGLFRGAGPDRLAHGNGGSWHAKPLSLFEQHVQTLQNANGRCKARRLRQIVLKHRFVLSAFDLDHGIVSLYFLYVEKPECLATTESLEWKTQ